MLSVFNLYMVIAIWFGCTAWDMTNSTYMAYIPVARIQNCGSYGFSNYTVVNGAGTSTIPWECVCSCRHQHALGAQHFSSRCCQMYLSRPRVQNGKLLCVRKKSSRASRGLRIQHLSTIVSESTRPLRCHPTTEHAQDI